VPLEKEKLQEIVNEHQLMFATAQREYEQRQEQLREKTQLPHGKREENGIGKGEAGDDLGYLECYYPYVLNVCISISLELFYRQECPVQVTSISEGEDNEIRSLPTKPQQKKGKDAIETNR
jgi:hypothetical protein